MNFKRIRIKLFVLLAMPMAALSACAGSPIDVLPVSGFEANRYLGTWYEVARLDHSFERGLSNITAQYSRRDDGKITVLNRGYNEKRGKFEIAKGKAKYAADPSSGHLKVSFFGPFYADYIIFDLDAAGYSYASVSGGKDSYLWLLSRSPSVPAAVRETFIKRSKALGYNTDGLIWVDHSR